MPKVNYPEGVQAPVRRGLSNEQPQMRNYTVNPVRNHKPKWKPHKRHSKYNARKIHAYNHVFDSKIEFQFYCYLRFFLKIPFKMHLRFEILPHTEYIGKTDGKWHAIRAHSYTPDYCIYDSNGNLLKVIDIKGMNSRGTPYDHLRFDLFSRRYRIPVYTVVKRHGQFITKIWGR